DADATAVAVATRADAGSSTSSMLYARRGVVARRRPSVPGQSAPPRTGGGQQHGALFPIPPASNSSPSHASTTPAASHSLTSISSFIRRQVPGRARSPQLTQLTAEVGLPARSVPTVELPAARVQTASALHAAAVPLTPEDAVGRVGASTDICTAAALHHGSAQSSCNPLLQHAESGSGGATPASSTGVIAAHVAINTEPPSAMPTSSLCDSVVHAGQVIAPNGTQPASSALIQPRAAAIHWWQRVVPTISRGGAHNATAEHEASAFGSGHPNAPRLLRVPSHLGSCDTYATDQTLDASTIPPATAPARAASPNSSSPCATPADDGLSLRIPFVHASRPSHAPFPVTTSFGDASPTLHTGAVGGTTAFTSSNSRSPTGHELRAARHGDRVLPAAAALSPPVETDTVSRELRALLPFDPVPRTQYMSSIPNNVEPTDDVVKLRVECCDDGRGMSAEQQANLFKPFMQVDAGVRQKGKGTGLGLNIVLEFAKRHGGVVGATSTPGQGSTFFFEVPLRMLHRVSRHGVRAALSTALTSCGTESSAHVIGSLGVAGAQQILSASSASDSSQDDSPHVEAARDQRSQSVSQSNASTRKSDTSVQTVPSAVSMRAVNRSTSFGHAQASSATAAGPRPAALVSSTGTAAAAGSFPVSGALFNPTLASISSNASMVSHQRLGGVGGGASGGSVMHAAPSSVTMSAHATRIRTQNSIDGYTATDDSISTTLLQTVGLSARRVSLQPVSGSRSVDDNDAESAHVHELPRSGSSGGGVASISYSPTSHVSMDNVLMASPTNATTSRPHNDSGARPDAHRFRAQSSLDVTDGAASGGARSAQSPTAGDVPAPPGVVIESQGSDAAADRCVHGASDGSSNVAFHAGASPPSGRPPAAGAGATAAASFKAVQRPHPQPLHVVEVQSLSTVTPSPTPMCSSIVDGEPLRFLVVDDGMCACSRLPLGLRSAAAAAAITFACVTRIAASHASRAACAAASNRKLLVRTLRKRLPHATFVEAGDGAEAVETVRVHGTAAFDVICMDKEMPLMDG
ncbi:MAG: hybrid sensor histidine kinase/response regulator, partial [Methanobacteriota archaeon]